MSFELALKRIQYGHRKGSQSHREGSVVKFRSCPLNSIVRAGRRAETSPCWICTLTQNRWGSLGSGRPVWIVNITVQCQLKLNMKSIVSHTRNRSIDWWRFSCLQSDDVEWY